jgi:hypothetical protein
VTKQQSNTPSEPPQNQRPPLEWVGGIASLPAELTAEGESYHPQVLVWMEDGLVLGSQVTTAEEVLFVACASLLETMVAPLVGDAREPARVRVASKELAEALRAGHPSLEVVVAATPALDEVFAQIADHGEAPEYELPRLTGGLDAAAVGSFFQAAAALFRLEPWKLLPSNGALFALSVPGLGLNDGVLSVMSRGEESGPGEQSVQFSLFSTLDSFVRFLNGADDDVQLGGTPKAASHLMLTFERRSEILPELLDEITSQGWEVAGPLAYPEVVSVDGGLATSSATAQEITMAEVVSRGLVEIMAVGDALQAAWESESPVSGLFSVSTHQADVQISLSTPFMPDLASDLSSGVASGIAPPRLGLVSEVATPVKGASKVSKAQEAKRRSKRKAARKARRKKR